MFGFYPGQRVLIKKGEEYIPAIIIRQFIASQFYLVQFDDGTQSHIERKDIRKDESPR
jgi:hypothetical protein